MMTNIILGKILGKAIYMRIIAYSISYITYQK